MNINTSPISSLGLKCASLYHSFSMFDQHDTFNNTHFQTIVAFIWIVTRWTLDALNLNPVWINRHMPNKLLKSIIYSEISTAYLYYHQRQSCQISIFVVRGGTIGCHNYKLLCRWWRQSWHLDNSLFPGYTEKCYAVALFTELHHFTATRKRG